MGCKLCKEKNDEPEPVNYRLSQLEHGYTNKAISVEDEQLAVTSGLDTTVISSQSKENNSAIEDESEHASKQDENSKFETDKSVDENETWSDDSKEPTCENDNISSQENSNDHAKDTAKNKDLELEYREINIEGDMKIDNYDAVSLEVELQEVEDASLKDVELNEESALSVKDEDEIGYDNKGLSLEDEKSVCSNFSDNSLCEGNQDSFLNPEAIEVLKCTPVDSSKKKYLKMEESFWGGKRKLIPDYSVMLKIDEHALQTPKNLEDNPEALVEYLLKGADTDLEKVRVLIRWIGDNIAYDVKGRDAGNADSSFEGVLRSGKAVCEGYANVVSEFCRMADIECRKISGQTKNGEFGREIRVQAKSDHAWNQIKIGDVWYFVDSTWGAGAVGGFEFTKKWEEAWFLSDPYAFIHTHLPLDMNGKINTEYQDIVNPFTSSQEWDELVYRSPLACVFGLEPITNQKKIINITDSKLELRYKCNENLLQHCVIISNEGGSMQLGHEWNMVYEKNGVVTASLRFPGQDVYNVDVMASVMYEGDVDKSIIRCFQYIVINTGNKTDPFPGSLNLGEDFVNAGFKLMQPVSPIVNAQNGLARIKVKLPTNGIVPMMFHFVKPNSEEEQERNLDDHVYCEKKGRVATFYMQCPEEGEYSLTLYIKLEQGQKYTSAANILVISDKISDPLFLIPKSMCSLIGPEAEFYNLGFTTDRKMSTIYFSGEKEVLQIKKTRGAFMMVKLESAADLNANEMLEKEETGEKCTITINKPNMPGFYFIQLYGGPKKYESMSQIGNFCVAYKIPFLKSSKTLT